MISTQNSDYPSFTFESFNQKSVDDLINTCFSEQSEKIKKYSTHLFQQKKKLTKIEICDKIIQKFKNDKKFKNKVLKFDIIVAQLKKQDSIETKKSPLILSGNVEKLNKWKRYGFDAELFYKSPDFVNFLFDSSLGSQMKVTKNSKLKEIDQEPALLVEGKWTKAHTVLKKFEVKFDPIYKEKFIFKKNTDQVYTYTDTGKGLVAFHPYKEGLKTPISKINKEDYEKVLENAQKFIRETDGLNSDKEKSSRTCILQIVSSRVNTDKKYGIFAENLFNLINRKHPWIRLIELDDNREKASVYAVGFGWKKKPFLPIQTTLGRFRSIDSWEYQSAERIVTNIAITPTELKKIQQFPEPFISQQNPAAFNLMSQNCSVGVRTVISNTTGIAIPTEIGIDSLLMRISPNFFQKTIHQLKTVKRKFTSLMGRITPTIISKSLSFLVNKITVLYKATVAFRLTLIGMLIGSASVSEKGTKLQSKDKVFNSPVKKINYWFDLSLHKVNLPGILQEWQEKQTSTVIYPKGRQEFGIVPPE